MQPKIVAIQYEDENDDYGEVGNGSMEDPLNQSYLN
jgi:hypothetical protein